MNPIFESFIGKTLNYAQENILPNTKYKKMFVDWYGVWKNVSEEDKQMWGEREITCVYEYDETTLFVCIHYRFTGK